MTVQTHPRQARRLIRALDLPSAASKVLHHPKYWSEAFCLLYLEACDEALFEDPHAGLGMARIAPTLAARIAPELCEGGSKRKRELRVRAFAVLGGAWRRVGDIARANAVYSEAHAEAEAISPAESANLKRRLAVLRIDQRRFDEALELSTQAIAICEPLAGCDLGNSLLTRGMVHSKTGSLSKAILDFSEALTYLNPKKQPRSYYSALYNLTSGLTHPGNHPDDLCLSLQNLKQARRLVHMKRGSLPKLKLRWLEGLAFDRLACTRHAERLLSSARLGLIELKVPFEVAMISLDLSLIYFQQHRRAELRELAAETYTLFTSLCVDREATAALMLWVSAAQNDCITAQLLADVRADLAEKNEATTHRT